MRLRERGVGAKRNLAIREFALGHGRSAASSPRAAAPVHECVFAVLALESEPIDPALTVWWTPFPLPNSALGSAAAVVADLEVEVRDEESLFRPAAGALALALATAPAAAERYSHGNSMIRSSTAQDLDDLRGTHPARPVRGLVMQDAPPTSSPAPPRAGRSPTTVPSTLKLRETVWSNGDPVTADDFVYSFRRLRDPATGAGTPRCSMS